jgi:hypothetical protein
VWRLRPDGGVDLFPRLPYATPTARHAFVKVDYRPPWEWIVMYFVYAIINAAGYFGFFALAVAGRKDAVKPWWTAFTSLNLVTLVVAAIGFAADGRGREAADAGMRVPKASGARHSTSCTLHTVHSVRPFADRRPRGRRRGHARAQGKHTHQSRTRLCSGGNPVFREVYSGGKGLRVAELAATWNQPCRAPDYAVGVIKCFG